MRLANHIKIAASPERVYALAADIASWPSILPHYRYVRVEAQGPGWRTARMGALHGIIPVWWRARQELVPAECRIRFTHIGGISKGMEVEWKIEQDAGGCTVTISHELRYPIPLVGPLFARYVVLGYFVHGVASRTLACMRCLAEEQKPCGAQ